ncbi:MAG: hypothetical protein EAZ98_16580 [Oscillatoriales cyanobacterium]|uniref:hypothetical protein n=1 Tax=Microcoleus anatoxicus TaxID=2705319 RepID=UPI0030C9B6F9|nr:MAG: hypothetical protein EAZ98_16580 [Oscillatoriales cyanobacterium]
MSQTQILVSSWACLTFVTILSGMGSLYVRGRPIVLKLADFMNLALATTAIVSSCSLIYRAATLKELEILLGFDIVTLYLGAIAVIWLSTQQIWQIFR